MARKIQYLLPAYGRKYRSQEEIIDAWETGQDFRLQGNSLYCSIRDLDALSNVADVLYSVYYPGEDPIRIKLHEFERSLLDQIIP
jgi:hypothetical protein